MASIFDEIGAPPPANAPIGSAQWQDWAGRQNYLKQLRAQLPPGTPLDLPEPVLAAIANGGRPEQSVDTWQDRVWSQNPYEQVIPPDPRAMADVNRMALSLWWGEQAASLPTRSMRHGGRVGALTIARLAHQRRR